MHADVKLLRLIFLYESSGKVNMYQYRPFLWGQAAISYYSVSKKMNLSLRKQPKMETVLENFDTNTLLKSALNFPLDLPLRVISESSCNEDELLLEDLYDPRFLLPMFSQLLSPENFVHFPKFIESGCLSFIFASLASYDVEMRAAGYHLLESFHLHLEGVRKFRSRQIYLLLLSILKNGITSQNVRLPSITALFLSKVSLVFYHAGDPMYQPLCNYVTLRPFLDVHHVPEFYNLFFSDDISFAHRRRWLLKLLAEGMRRNIDFYVCERRHIFRLLLSMYNSSLFDQQSKALVLQILTAASKSPTAVKKLVKYYNFIGWIQGALNDRNFNCEQKTFINLLHDVWNTLKTKDSNSKPKSKVDKQKQACGSADDSNQSEEEAEDNAVEAVPNSANKCFHQIMMAMFTILDKSCLISQEELSMGFSCVLSILHTCTSASLMLSSGYVSSALKMFAKLDSMQSEQENEMINTPTSSKDLLLQILIFWKPEQSYRVVVDVMSFLIKHVSPCNPSILNDAVKWIHSQVSCRSFLQNLICDHSSARNVIYGLLDIAVRSLSNKSLLCLHFSTIVTEVNKSLVEILETLNEENNSEKRCSVISNLKNWNFEDVEILKNLNRSENESSKVFEKLCMAYLGFRNDSAGSESKRGKKRRKSRQETSKKQKL